MTEVRTRAVHATLNPDGTWYVVLTKPDGTTLCCPEAPEALMLQTVAYGNQQQPETEASQSALVGVLSVLLSPTVLTAFAAWVLLGRGC